MLSRLLQTVRAPYLMQRLITGQQNRYYRQGIINILYLNLYEARIYSSKQFEERFTFLLFMNLVRFKKEPERINKLFDYLV